MSTEVFTYPVTLSYTESINWKTLITAFEDGKEQRRKKWSNPRRVFTLQYRGSTKTDINGMWDFYNDRYGAYDTFYWENTNESPLETAEAIMTGDGLTKNFQLDNYPVISGECVLTVEGVAQTEVTDYTIDYASGSGDFVSAPGDGEVVAGTYSFYRIVRFFDDRMSKEEFAYRVYNAQLRLIEII